MIDMIIMYTITTGEQHMGCLLSPFTHLTVIPPRTTHIVSGT